MAKQKAQFQTEVKQILDLMINSLYSQKEIFLRELISNASDAIDRLKFEALTQTELLPEGYNPEIRLTANTEARTLKIQDNGIGMSYDEVVQNIGTIAKSGTREFLKITEEMKDHPEMIGQFGVGFYSSFMVADKVTLHTQRAGDSEGVLWESDGCGEYTIDRVPRSEGAGTTVILHLKEKAEGEEGFEDFSEQWTLESLVKKYSDFISHPILMKVTRSEPKKDEKGEIIPDQYEDVIEDKVLNSSKAIWLRPTSEVKEDEYNDFYKHCSHDWNNPLHTIHYRAEGIIEFNALMYIPENRPWDFYYKESKKGLNLYVKRVFISNDCDALLPHYLRFMKGVVDSSDLSLNVSREILQQDRQVLQLNKSLTTKILNTLKELKEKDYDKYLKFWKAFGPTLKEGIVEDMSNQKKISDLILFYSTKSEEFTTFQDYISRMKPDQKEIYYITGEHLEQIKASPYLEALKDREYEVLLLTDNVDDWVMERLAKYDDKKLVSVTKENLELDSDVEKKEKEEIKKTQKERFSSLIEFMKKSLGEKVKDVQISSRLKDSPVCLVSGQFDPSAHMQRVLSKSGAVDLSGMEQKKIMEINVDHPLFEKMLSATEETQKNWAEILYGQALLNEGTPLPDPGQFSKKVSDLMMGSLSS